MLWCSLGKVVKYNYLLTAVATRMYILPDPWSDVNCLNGL